MVFFGISNPILGGFFFFLPVFLIAFFKFLKSVNNKNYITFDLNSPLADIKGDICAMPFEDNFFDFILFERKAVAK